MRIDFLGGTGTVTGSKYLLTHEGRRLLVDCGLFQGLKQLRLRNWDALPFDASAIDAVLLTHAHMDHSGFVPRLVKLGFKGKVYCTAATRDLCELLLPDSGRLQEEEADFANRHGHSRHKPALPLYAEQDARAALKRFECVSFDEECSPWPGWSCRPSRWGARKSCRIASRCSSAKAAYRTCRWTSTARWPRMPRACTRRTSTSTA